MRQKLLDLGFRKAFALERHLHPEVEQRVHPELRWRIAADRRFHLRACGAVHAPTRWHPHDHPGAFERGNILQELQSLLRAPAQRVKDLAGIDHRLQPGAISAARWTGISSESRRWRFSRRNTPARLCRAADAGPWPQPRVGSCRSQETRTGLLRPSGSPRG